MNFVWEYYFVEILHEYKNLMDDELIPPPSVLGEQFHDAIAMRKS